MTAWDDRRDPVRCPTVETEDFNRLRLSRDEAMSAAGEAVRDATRLTRLLTVLNDSGDLGALLDRALSTLSELFATEVVVLLDPAGTGSYVPLASVGLPEDLASMPFPCAPSGNVCRTMREGGPLLVRDGTIDATIEPQLRDLDVGTALYLPVSASHAARGVLILARCRAEPFQVADVGLLTAMAYRIGLAVEQAQRRAQLECIVRSERAIGVDLEEIGIAGRAVKMFPELVGADDASFVLIDSDGRILHRADHGSARLADDELAGLVADLLATTALRRFEAHTAVTTAPSAGAEPARGGGRPGALLALPIGRDRLEGLLVAFRAMPTPFDPDLHTIAMLYAGQTSAALENARLYRAVHAELADRKRAERAVKASEERLGALIRSVHDLIVVLGPMGDIRFRNPAATVVWAAGDTGAADADFWRRISPRDIHRLRDILRELERSPGATATCAVGLIRTDGSRHEYDVVLTNLLAEPAVGGVVATFHDVTDRKSYESRLEDLAFRDPLTGLANRAYFQDRLRRALTQTHRLGQPVAVIFFDLDNFKVVNDSLGHEAGDRILKAVAERMRAHLRHDDIGARLGGDEFTVLVEGEAAVAAVRSLAERLLESIREPISIGRREVVVGGSFGIAIGEAGRQTAEDLLRKADVAMYHAKVGGKNACAVFDESLEVAAMRRLEAETDLRRALARDELDVYFQPIVSLEDGRLVGAEALMRWHHPERGLVGPCEFIAVAETTGLIVEVGRKIIDAAFSQLDRWRTTAGIALPLNLNLSPRQLCHEALVADLIGAAQRHGVDPRSIALEITETTLIRNPEAAIRVVERLHDLGFRIAIDDFGTGYSSLSYLKRLPVDGVKIDRSFVAAVDTDRRDEAIVRSILALGEALGLEVVAEGIETVGQQAVLRSIGCRTAQGFLFAPALPAEDFARLLPLATRTPVAADPSAADRRTRPAKG